MWRLHPSIESAVRKVERYQSPLCKVTKNATVSRQDYDLDRLGYLLRNLKKDERQILNMAPLVQLKKKIQRKNCSFLKTLHLAPSQWQQWMRLHEPKFELLPSPLYVWGFDTSDSYLRCSKICFRKEWFGSYDKADADIKAHFGGLLKQLIIKYMLEVYYL